MDKEPTPLIHRLYYISPNNAVVNDEDLRTLERRLSALQADERDALRYRTMLSSDLTDQYSEWMADALNGRLTKHMDQRIDEHNAALNAREGKA